MSFRLNSEVAGANMPHPDDFTVGIYEKALPPSISWLGRLAMAAQAGFDFIEISIDESDERLERLNWGQQQRTALREAIAETSIPITSLCLSAHRKYPMGSTSEKTRQKGLELMERTIEFAQDVGVRIVLVPGYDVFYEPSDPATREHFLEGLRQGLVWASGAGVMLALENTDHSVTSVSEAMWYVKQFNSPWLQLYCDIGNLNAFQHDILEELEVGAGHIVGVHVKDTLPGQFRRVTFGEGTVPFVAAFRKLWEVSFVGPIMLEMWVEDADDPLQILSEARRWIQGRLEASLQPQEATRESLEK
jgi:L-ribulose-5-phosphate 3-epimerase